MPVSAFSSPDRTTRVGVVTLTVVVFAVVVGFVTLRLRGELQRQILDREANMLASVTAMQLAHETETVRALGIPEVPGAMFAAVLRASKLADTIAMRMVDAQKRVVNAVPWVWSEQPPAPADWSELLAGRPITRLHARDSETIVPWLSAMPAAALETRVPLIEAWVPLHGEDGRTFSGAAQFWMNGEEFAALDRKLLAQAAMAWLAGSLVIVAALGWTFRRLADVNRELRVRSENLQRANRELVLAAKTTALGTVTAHLMHALKNPLAGLEVFVANQAEPAGRADKGEELAAATELTRRLRTMVNDVVSVLRDEQSGASFELTAAEVVELALAKARTAAEMQQVTLTIDKNTEAPLAARRANLAVLVLHNLLQNAIEASRRAARVHIGSARLADGGVEFVVTDEAAGLPSAVRERLFEPCTSTKLGGSGLGLALSQQLARQAGGRLELLRSDETGTSFRLVLAPEA